MPRYERAEIIEPTNMIEVGVIDTDYFLESIKEKRSPSNRDKNWFKFYDRLNTQYMMAEKTWEGNQKYIELAHRVDVEFRKVYTISITMPSRAMDSIRNSPPSRMVYTSFLRSIYPDLLALSMIPVLVASVPSSRPSKIAL